MVFPSLAQITAEEVDKAFVECKYRRGWLQLPRLTKGRESVVGFVKRYQVISQVAPRHWEIASESEAAVTDSDCLICAPTRMKNTCAIQMRLREARLKLDGYLTRSERLVQSAQFLQRNAPIVMYLRLVGIKEQ
jgi:hypothetical protein